MDGLTPNLSRVLAAHQRLIFGSFMPEQKLS